MIEKLSERDWKRSLNDDTFKWGGIHVFSSRLSVHLVTLFVIDLSSPSIHQSQSRRNSTTILKRPFNGIMVTTQLLACLVSQSAGNSSAIHGPLLWFHWLLLFGNSKVLKTVDWVNQNSFLFSFIRYSKKIRSFAHSNIFCFNAESMVADYFFFSLCFLAQGKTLSIRRSHSHVCLADWLQLASLDI